MPELPKTGIVQSFERVSDENGERCEVQVDASVNELLTLEHVDSCGDDAPPLPGDSAAISESTGQGTGRSAGYVDTKNAGVALPGEKRVYGRAPDGSVAGFVHFHGDGLVEIKGLAAGERYKIGPVEIDAQGNITTPGDITVKKDTTPVTLSLHKHGSGTGPTTPPLPA